MDSQEHIDETVHRIQEMNEKIKNERSLVMLKDKDIPKGIIRLENIGNTCYMNSILQCLLNIPDINKYFVDPLINKKTYEYVLSKVSDENSISEIIKKTLHTLTFQLHSIFKASWTLETKYIKPSHFKQIFGNVINSFKNSDQHDAQEALMCILDTIHTEHTDKKEHLKIEITYNLFPPEYLEIFIRMKDLCDLECCKLENEYPNIWELYLLKNTIDRYNTKTYSVITEYFQNIISSSLQCPICNYHTTNFDPMIVLSIDMPIQKHINIEKLQQLIEQLKLDDLSEEIKQAIIMEKIQKINLTLDQCLDNFTKLEILEDDEKWNCPHCDKKVNGLKRMTIFLPPKIMIIHLKRFDFQGNKINNLVEFPISDFNINKYMANYSSQFKDYTYDLISVVNHNGNINNGHYYSFVKSDFNKEWYCCNDDCIFKIDDTKLITNSAYILFYILK
jgi:ubiquitin C-terminal hydrolase